MLRKLISLFSLLAVAMLFVPMSTYAATTHTTKHTKHVVHTSSHAKKTKKPSKHVKKTKKTSKKQVGQGAVQGGLPYVIVGTMEPQKQFTWNDILSHGSNWLNYMVSNSKTTWHDPGR